MSQRSRPTALILGVILIHFVSSTWADDQRPASIKAVSHQATSAQYTLPAPANQQTPAADSESSAAYLFKYVYQTCNGTFHLIARTGTADFLALGPNGTWRKYLVVLRYGGMDPSNKFYLYNIQYGGDTAVQHLAFARYPDCRDFCCDCCCWCGFCYPNWGYSVWYTLNPAPVNLLTSSDWIYYGCACRSARN
jgi:hypothetical protein